MRPTGQSRTPIANTREKGCEMKMHPDVDFYIKTGITRKTGKNFRNAQKAATCRKPKECSNSKLQASLAP